METTLSRKPHPADAFHEKIVREAVRFDISLFLGSGRFAHATAATLDEARAQADRLRAEHPNGRGAMIYAVNAAGRTGLVTSQLMKELTMSKTEKKTTAKKAAPKAGPKLLAEVINKPIKEHRAKKSAKPTPAPEAGKGPVTVANLAAIKAAEAACDDKPTIRSVESLTQKKARERAAKAEKPAKANGKGDKQAKADKPLGKRAAIEAACRSGKMPTIPDFSADTHKRFRPKLDEVVAMAKAGDLKGLKSYKYKGFVSTSPKAILRYRDLCVMALEAKAAK
jgi:hypothetical protein